MTSSYLKRITRSKQERAIDFLRTQPWSKMTPAQQAFCRHAFNGRVPVLEADTVSKTEVEFLPMIYGCPKVYEGDYV